MAATMASQDEFTCGRCGAVSRWVDHYYQQNTPDTPFPPAYDFWSWDKIEHYRAFCPKCGALVAEQLDPRTGELGWIGGARPRLTPPEAFHSSAGGQWILTHQFRTHLVPWGKDTLDIEGYQKVWATSMQEEEWLESAPVGQLIRRLRESKGKRADNVERAISSRGKEAVPFLVEALRDPEVYLRWRVCYVLAAIGEQAREARPALEEALNDSEESVRRGASAALGRIPEPPGDAARLAVRPLPPDTGARPSPPPRTIPRKAHSELRGWGIALAAILTMVLLAMIPSAMRYMTFHKSLQKVQEADAQGRMTAPFKKTDDGVRGGAPAPPPIITKVKPSATQSGTAASESKGEDTKPPAAAPAHRQQVTALTTTPDCRMLASASSDGTMKLWSLPQGKLLRSLTGHKSGVYSMVMSSDGKRLYSGSHEDSIIVWSLPDGGIVQRLDNRMDGSMTAMAIAPASKVLAAGTFTASLTLWSLPQGQLLKTIRAAYGLNAIAFTPDGNTVAGGSFGPIQLWSVPEGNTIGSLNIDQESVKVLTVTPDGNILVSASGGDDIIRLWSLTERKLLMEVKSKSKQIGSMTISQDGRILATGSADGVIEFWSLPRGTPLSAMSGHNDAICALTFSSDGNLLVSGDENGAVYLWDFNKKSLLRQFFAN